jgi:hypothetical protein
MCLTPSRSKVSSAACCVTVACRHGQTSTGTRKQVVQALATSRVALCHGRYTPFILQADSCQQLLAWLHT